MQIKTQGKKVQKREVVKEDNTKIFIAGKRRHQCHIITTLKVGVNK